jgi:hypothetical protein
MRRLKNPNQWPPGGWNYEEPSTGFRFRGSSLQDLAAKVKIPFEMAVLWWGEPLRFFQIPIRVDSGAERERLGQALSGNGKAFSKNLQLPNQQAVLIGV